MKKQIRGDAYLISYTKLNVNVISLFITAIIYITTNFLWVQGTSFAQKLTIQEKYTKEAVENVEINRTNEIERNEEPKENISTEQEEIIEEIEIQEIGTIEIPAINLIAPIAEDTTQIIMDKYVGHFVNTSLWNGNIGLAAHNRRISS